MVNRKISEIFNLEVESDNIGSVLIPLDIFTAQNDTLDQVALLIREEANRVGQPFFMVSVVTSSGVLISWSKDFMYAIPVLENEEQLMGSGLTYIVRKVG